MVASVYLINIYCMWGLIQIFFLTENPPDFCHPQGKTIGTRLVLHQTWFMRLPTSIPGSTRAGSLPKPKGITLSLPAIAAWLVDLTLTERFNHLSSIKHWDHCNPVHGNCSFGLKNSFKKYQRFKIITRVNYDSWSPDSWM